MLPRPSENLVRSKNLSDPHQFLEEGIFLQAPNYLRRDDRRRNSIYEDEEMQERTHIRQRSGYLSPTIGGSKVLSGPMNDDAGTRQRKTAARVDQGSVDTTNEEGKTGLGLSLGTPLEFRKERSDQVVLEKPRKDSYPIEPQGLTGKDRRAFVLLVMLCKSPV
jgi:hypothetical protein